MVFCGTTKPNNMCGHNNMMEHHCSKYIIIQISWSRFFKLRIIYDSSNHSEPKCYDTISLMSRVQRVHPDVMGTLFTALVQPIIEYGAEVWGVRHQPTIGRVLLQFCKDMLGLPPNTIFIAVHPQWLQSQ